MTDADLFRALGNERRLQILAWLRDPRAHFRPQTDGDLVEDGVCGQLIAEKLGINASTLSEHMRILARQRPDIGEAHQTMDVLYRRNEARLQMLAAVIGTI